MTTRVSRDDDRRISRRVVLRVGSMAAALFAALGREALTQTPTRIDIHAHLWSADYLDPRRTVHTRS
jgi:hypothetical protein